MGLLLNKKIITLLTFLCIAFIGLAQDEERVSEKDYKDRKQFDNFYTHRKLIGAWQINELKRGALVVRLKANKFVIDALIKNGNVKMADKKRIEALAINLNISRAYRNNYSFSKVYFMYSHYSDSLISGVRKNIFLDSNMVIDSNIEMTEKFYLIAEYDDIYNSSIGFVPEDSARFISEHGNVTTHEAPIVVKNKYGHQLKLPFPYKYYFQSARRLTLKPIYKEDVFINGEKITFKASPAKSNNTTWTLIIPEDLAYVRISDLVKEMNDEFRDYYGFNPKPPIEKLEKVKLFLY